MLGGVLALLGAPELAFAINGATFLVSASTLLFVHIPPREAKETAEEEEAWLSETLAGFRFLFRENEGVLATLTVSFVSLSFVGATRPCTSRAARDLVWVFASLRRRERMLARLRATIGVTSMLARRVLRSIHRKDERSRVRTLAERPRLSARLISPTISPGP